MAYDNPIPLSSPEPTSAGLTNSVRLYLPDVSELEKLPLSGRITFDYKRESIKLSGADRMSAELELTAICEVEADEESEDADDSVDKLYSEVAKKAREAAE